MPRAGTVHLREQRSLAELFSAAATLPKACCEIGRPQAAVPTRARRLGSRTTSTVLSSASSCDWRIPCTLKSHSRPGSPTALCSANSTPSLSRAACLASPGMRTGATYTTLPERPDEEWAQCVLTADDHIPVRAISPSGTRTGRSAAPQGPVGPPGTRDIPAHLARYPPNWTTMAGRLAEHVTKGDISPSDGAAAPLLS